MTHITLPLAVHTHTDPFKTNVDLNNQDVTVNPPTQVNKGLLYATVLDKVIGEMVDVSIVFTSKQDPKVTFAQVTRSFVLNDEDYITFDTLTVSKNNDTQRVNVPYYPVDGTGNISGEKFTLTFKGYTRTSKEPFQYNYILDYAK